MARRKYPSFRKSAILRNFFSVPYWMEPWSAVEKHDRLKRYPGAGRLWKRLNFEQVGDDKNVKMVKEVIAGSMNVREVCMRPLWNEAEAKVVLIAIASLGRVEWVTFGHVGPERSLRKLALVLFPFSFLHEPLDWSHLVHLTYLILDGGAETSNLVQVYGEFLGTLKTTEVKLVELAYLVTDCSELPHFIHWFYKVILWEVADEVLHKALSVVTEHGSRDDRVDEPEGD
ncbi:hypothetical protein BT69DRAFT_1326724 [Atractiella rhizophila]|nr:hypothetical protein BT69DRAFT_1326724 [Atractiella rhizophila]